MNIKDLEQWLHSEIDKVDNQDCALQLERVYAFHEVLDKLKQINSGPREIVESFDEQQNDFNDSDEDAMMGWLQDNEDVMMDWLRDKD